MKRDEFIRMGEAARLLAFHLGQRFGSTGLAHLETARGKLLDAAREGSLAIVAGPESWADGAASFKLPMECVHGLHTGNIDWDESVFDASSDVPVEATAAIQQLHSGPSTLWVPLSDLSASFQIGRETISRFAQR